MAPTLASFRRKTSAGAAAGRPKLRTELRANPLQEPRTLKNLRAFFSAGNSSVQLSGFNVAREGKGKKPPKERTVLEATAFCLLIK